MRIFCCAILLTGTLSADVLVLKDGAKVAGRIVEKPDRYEITSDGGLRSYLKDEVEKILTSPKELLGDSDKVFEQAKQEYQAALTLADDDQRNSRLKETIGKVKTVRDALAAARELFPEEKFAELDQKLLQVMQLTRLLRERVTADLARSPGGRVINDPMAKARSPEALNTAFSALLDPARRADPVARSAARESFRAQRVHFPEAYDIATAALVFLSRPETDWKLQGQAAKAVNDYFAQPWLKDPLKLTPEVHQQAAAWVIDRLNALRKSDANAPVDALALFGIGHYAHAPLGAESEKNARLLGLIVKNGIPGTPEGHVVRELNAWIGSGDYDLAVLSWVKEYREIDTPIVRYVWSYALLRLAQAKKKGFDRPISALETVRVSDAAALAHLASLAKSIKAEASCSPCGGEGKFRCPNCCGKKETRTDCMECKGSGKKLLRGKGGRASEVPCYPCRGRGFLQKIVCEKCKDGTVLCGQCGGKSQPPPELEEICSFTPCRDCDGRGWIFRNILWACKGCMGIGQKLIPKTDPAKTLP